MLCGVARMVALAARLGLGTLPDLRRPLLCSLSHPLPFALSRWARARGRVPRQPCPPAQGVADDWSRFPSVEDLPVCRVRSASLAHQWLRCATHCWRTGAAVECTAAGRTHQASSCGREMSSGGVLVTILQVFLHLLSGIRLLAHQVHRPLYGIPPQVDGKHSDSCYFGRFLHRGLRTVVNTPLRVGRT